MAGFGFLNRFYYGKAGQADYTLDQLPSNRTQLFFEMLRIHFSGIMLVNLVYLVFCLPGIIWTGLNLIVLLGGEQVQDVAANQGVLFLYLLGMIPCLGLAGVGATGEMYVLRNWARDQHAFTLSDFKDAVRGNWKHGLITGLLGGLSLFVAAICYTFYGQMASESLIWLVPQMLAVAVVSVWWMANMVIFPMMVTYEMNYRTLVRNSMIVVIARLPWTLLFFALPVAVPVLIALFVPYGEIAVILLYLVIGFALTGFIYASYAVSCFDKYLNPRNEGAPGNMGLRDTALDDEDDKDQSDKPSLV